jgi:hypothetical protein
MTPEAGLFKEPMVPDTVQGVAVVVVGGGNRKQDMKCMYVNTSRCSCWLFKCLSASLLGAENSLHRN